MGMGAPKCTKGQKGFIIGLGKQLGQEISWDELEYVSVGEASEMIQKMKIELGMDNELDRMRKKIISLARTIGWQVENPEDPWKPKPDMQRINNWCQKYGMYKKRLNDHSKKELIDILTQFEKMYAWKLKTNQK